MIKICKICKEEFEAKRANSAFCDKEHYQPCKNCGKTFFVKKISKPKEFCSVSCSAKYRNDNNVILKVCELCGTEFNAMNSNAKYCNNKHYKICENCGNTFEIINPYKKKDYCSRKCSVFISQNITNENTAKSLKKCKLCDNQFYGNKNSRFCKDSHYKNCENCGKEFLIKENKRPAKTCSKKCSDALTVKNSKKIVKICEWKNCKKEFKAIRNNIKFCNEEHFDTCLHCGKTFKIVNIHKPSYTCSKLCASKLIDFKARNNKSVETNLKKYGVENPSQIDAIKEKKKITTLENYGVVNPFNIPKVKERAIKNNGLTISKTNLKWQKKLKELFNVDFNLEVPFGDNFADLGYGKLLIDINPSFTHSSTISFVHLTKKCNDENCTKTSHKPRDPRYHQLRALEAEKNGFILLQYFDWMDEDKFLSIVRTKLKLNDRMIPAKKTIIKEISQVEANRFFKENHLFGASNMQELCIGLFYNDELVHCQTYGKARFNKNYEWEAIRSATKANSYIPGAFSKCDKYFFNKIDPDSVISYVDLSFSNGNTELMFDNWRTLKINKPSSTWVNLYNNEYPVFIKDSAARRVSADRLLGFEVGEKYPRFDKDGNKITNSDVLSREGFIEVFDAGTKTLVWEENS